MMSCGIFRIKAEIDTIFTVQFRAAVEDLEYTLKTAFPEEEFLLLRTESSRQVEDIVRSACKLLSRLQTGIFPSRLAVTIAPEMDVWYGTSTFGLDRYIGTERTSLLEPKYISDDMLQSFFT